MSKKKQKQTAETVAAIETVETVAIENLAEVTITEKRKGRPTVPGSARQMRLEAQAKRIAENGGIVKLGRPVVATSTRQQKIQERLSKLAAGEVIKRGRPKMIVAAEPTVTEATA